MHVAWRLSSYGLHHAVLARVTCPFARSTVFIYIMRVVCGFCDARDCRTALEVRCVWFALVVPTDLLEVCRLLFRCMSWMLIVCSVCAVGVGDVLCWCIGASVFPRGGLGLGAQSIVLVRHIYVYSERRVQPVQTPTLHDVFVYLWRTRWVAALGGFVEQSRLRLVFFILSSNYIDRIVDLVAIRLVCMICVRKCMCGCVLCGFGCIYVLVTQPHSVPIFLKCNRNRTQAIVCADCNRLCLPHIEYYWPRSLAIGVSLLHGV